MRRLLFILLSFNYLITYAQEPEFKGYGHLSKNVNNCLSDEEHQRELNQLWAKGVFDSTKVNNSALRTSNSIIKFIAPLAKDLSSPYNHNYYVSNFLDQDNTAGIQDHLCGSRSYNGHKGTDYVLWPFKWHQYKEGSVNVVAAAKGEIITKRTGNPDSNCVWDSKNKWNAVYLKHEDGSVTWYGHLKLNSLTSKNVGDTVEVGEYLGKVASSGFSNAPHLHFEVYNPSGNLIDPYQGNCNNLNTESYWEDQEFDTLPKFHALTTNTAVPQYGCIDVEEEYLSDTFMVGDSVYLMSFFSDQRIGDTALYKLKSPSGQIIWDFDRVFTRAFNASFWWWRYITNANTEKGTWTWETTFKGKTYNHKFEVKGLVTSNKSKLEKGVSLVHAIQKGSKLVIGKPENMPCKVVVINAIGVKCLEKETIENEISLASLYDGVYQILIESGGQLSKTKIIKW